MHLLKILETATASYVAVMLIVVFKTTGATVQAGAVVSLVEIDGLGTMVVYLPVIALTAVSLDLGTVYTSGRRQIVLDSRIGTIRPESIFFRPIT